MADRKWIFLFGVTQAAHVGGWVKKKRNSAPKRKFHPLVPEMEPTMGKCRGGSEYGPLPTTRSAFAQEPWIRPWPFTATGSTGVGAGPGCDLTRCLSRACVIRKFVFGSCASRAVMHGFRVWNVKDWGVMQSQLRLHTRV